MKTISALKTEPINLYKALVNHSLDASSHPRRLIISKTRNTGIP
jgi:hypothetical protein